MRVKSLLCVFFLLLMAGGVFAQVQTGSAYPKREFRAAWIQSVNGQFRGMPTEKLKQNLIGQLNSLQKAGINAIIFRYVPKRMLCMLPDWNRGVVSLPECRVKSPNLLGPYAVYD